MAQTFFSSFTELNTVSCILNKSHAYATEHIWNINQSVHINAEQN